MADDVRHVIGAAQHPCAIPQQKLWLFLGVALFLFNHKQRRLMRVFENREQSNAIQMVERIVAPFTSCDPGAVG